MEVWKPIVGYEDRYEISNLGRVKSLKKNGLIMSPCKGKDGYYRINLKVRKQQKMKMVHRLVAEAFIPNPMGLPQINHKNENKADNRVENLEWCTAKYNSNYGTHIERVSLSLSKPIFCVELNKSFKNAIEAAKFIGAAKGTITHINRCATGKESTCYGYRWRYL